MGTGQPVLKAKDPAGRGRVARLAVMAGYLSVLRAIQVAENTDGWPRYQKTYGWGVAALAFAAFSVAIAYRETKSPRHYHFTVLLLILAILFATVDGWVLITAPLWAAVLMAFKKRWFGPVA